MVSSRIDTFRQMLESDPGNNMVLFGLANEYLKAQAWQEAAETLERYLAQSDDEGAAFGMLARAYESLGRRTDARIAYEKGIAAASSHSHPSMAADFQMTLDTDYAQ